MEKTSFNDICVVYSYGLGLVRVQYDMIRSAKHQYNHCGTGVQICTNVIMMIN